MTRPLLLTLLALVCTTGTAAARTITVTAEDCDRIAVISDKAPRLSWAVYRPAVGVYDTCHELQMYQDMSLLIRFPLDKVPPGQRITKAELTVRADNLDGSPKLRVRRILAEWGLGVCHLYRMTHPQKLEWAQPSARGSTRDCAEKVTGVLHFPTKSSQVLDVTEDVELWYTGATTNHGWLMNLEAGYSVFIPSPYNPHTASGKNWKLQITYEPQ